MSQEKLYRFTAVETGETWVAPMPESIPMPANCTVVIGYPAQEQLVKEKDMWVPYAKARPI